MMGKTFRLKMKLGVMYIWIWAVCALLAGCSPRGAHLATYEVGFDNAYRRYDAVFPRMRESFLEGDGENGTALGVWLSSLPNGPLVEKAVLRFRAEYPEDGVTDLDLHRCLSSVEIKRLGATKIWTVAVRSDSGRLSERLAGTIARALADYASERDSQALARDLEGVRTSIRKVKSDLEKAQRKHEELARRGTEGKDALSQECAQLERLCSERLLPEYNRLSLEEERITRARELDRFAAYVLGPVRVAPAEPTNDVPVSAAAQTSPRRWLVDAERRALAEVDWQRRDWNDRWNDRLELVRLRTETPRRIYLLGSYARSSSGHDMDSCCQRNASVNTNDALFGFLGCRFGESAKDREHYVRLADPFEGFSWIRHVACGRCGKLARCDGRMSFRTTGLSEAPFRRMGRLREVFEKSYGLDFCEDRRGEDYFAGAYGEGGWRVGLFVTNTLVKVGDALRVEYTMGFDVVNEQVLPPRLGRQLDSGICNWNGFLQTRDIPRERRNDDGEWAYRTVRGRTTEELLDEFVKTGDRGILNVGRGIVGTSVRWSDGAVASGYFAAKGTSGKLGYQCTEWEADLVMPLTATFVKICDEETGARLSAKLNQPDMFRPREKGKNGNFTVGQIFWELIPGDRVTWYKPDCRKTGTVCEEGEDGEYWECIRKKMRDVETVEAAREEDWKPTELTRQMNERRQDVDLRSQRILRDMAHGRMLGRRDRRGPQPVDLTSTNLIATTNILADCLAWRRPGIYRGPFTESTLEMDYRSREFARRKVRHWEDVSVERCQYAMIDARRRLLEVYFPVGTFTNGVPANMARVFSLSRFECELFSLGGVERKKFFSVNPWDLSVVLPHHVFDAPPRILLREEIESIRTRLDACRDRLVAFSTGMSGGVMRTEGESVVLDVYEVLSSAFASNEGASALSKLLPCCRKLLAANIHHEPMGTVVRRLVLEFKDNPEVWRFAESIQPEIERIEGTAFVERRAQAGLALARWLSDCRMALGRQVPPSK